MKYKVFGYLLLATVLVVPPCIGQETRTFGAIASERSHYENLPSFSSKHLVAESPLTFEFPDLPLALHQGESWACTGFATAYALTLMKAHQDDGKVEEYASYFSPGYIYGSTKAPGDCTSGADMETVLNHLAFDGVVNWDEYPYDAVNCDPPPTSLKNSASNNTVTSWGRVSTNRPVSDLDLADMKKLLASGYPVVLVIEVPDDLLYWKPADVDEVYKTESNKSLGLHAVTAVGYNETMKAIKVINSWGVDWGSEGFAWISEETFKGLVAESYVLHGLSP